MSIEETTTREVTSVRGMYDKELSQAWKALDDQPRRKPSGKLRRRGTSPIIGSCRPSGMTGRRRLRGWRLERSNNMLEKQVVDAKKKADDATND